MTIWLFSLALGLMAMTPVFFARIAIKRLKYIIGSKLPYQKITVVQPILGGDPTLESNLTANARRYPNVEFLWLVDESDPIGQQAALQAKEHSNNPDVRIIQCPDAPKNQNPKSFKINRIIKQCRELLVVLDDDCVLQEQSLERLISPLRYSDLATGMPFYRDQGSFWTRLLAQFPNENSLVSYLPPLLQGAPQTINGMIYATPRKTLEDLGGFQSIAHKLCDDFELAHLYRSNGKAIAQALAAVEIRTVVSTPKEYFSIMRRWLFFTRRQLAELHNPFVIAFVVAPPLFLPLSAVISWLAWQPLLVASIAFVIRNRGARLLAEEGFGYDQTAIHWVLRLLSTLILPIHLITSLWPANLHWRNKQFAIKGLRMQWFQ